MAVGRALAVRTPSACARERATRGSEIIRTSRLGGGTRRPTAAHSTTTSGTQTGARGDRRGPAYQRRRVSSGLFDRRAEEDAERQATLTTCTLESGRDQWTVSPASLAPTSPWFCSLTDAARVQRPSRSTWSAAWRNALIRWSRPAASRCPSEWRRRYQPGPVSGLASSSKSVPSAGRRPGFAPASRVTRQGHLAATLRLRSTQKRRSRHDSPVTLIVAGWGRDSILAAGAVEAGGRGASWCARVQRHTSDRQCPTALLWRASADLNLPWTTSGRARTMLPSPRRLKYRVRARRLSRLPIATRGGLPFSSRRRVQPPAVCLPP